MPAGAVVFGLLAGTGAIVIYGLALRPLRLIRPVDWRASTYRSIVGVPRDPNIPDAFDVYTVVLLRRPVDAPDMPEVELDALQARHLAVPREAGRRRPARRQRPVRRSSRTQPLRGLSIWSCDLDEARRLSDLDPSVQAGRLAYDAFEWWVGAGTLAFPGTAHAVGERREMADD